MMTICKYQFFFFLRVCIEVIYTLNLIVGIPTALIIYPATIRALLLLLRGSHFCFDYNTA